MKKIFKLFMIGAVGTLSLSSCIEEVEPQTNYVTEEQAANAPGSFSSFVSNLPSNLSGKFLYSNISNEEYDPYDFGYTSFYLIRDVEGQDIVAWGGNNWFAMWYDQVSYMASGYANCQYPWTLYYGWIKNCNTVISMAGASDYATPIEGREAGAGIAYAFRAMFYLDLCRMYAAKPYAVDHNALTTIKSTETRTIAEATNSERMTWGEAFDFILKDLDQAEKLLANYQRPDKTYPDLSVVYGLKARTYLEMQDWANAEKYAKLAQQGYTMMSQSEYLSHANGFNSPNSSWMLGTRFQSTDNNITLNDGDSSWGSAMALETAWNGDTENGFWGYANGYGDPNLIDKHLYESIPKTDYRRQCWLDFRLDTLEAGDEAQQAEADSLLALQSSYPDRLKLTAETANHGLGGLSLKFRCAAGQNDVKYNAYCVWVPMMRVEEMKLIEIEAAGMQDEARGIQLLTEFAKTRDPNYVYGTHNEAYGNTSTSRFQNEVWWQRRVELWGEGFATFDIKRLNKGIIRSYAGTNHIENARWNTTECPNWMVWAFVGTESQYNGGMTLNPEPQQPEGDSPEYIW